MNLIRKYDAMYLPGMEHLFKASQNADTKYSLVTGLCSGVCVAELVVMTVEW